MRGSEEWERGIRCCDLPPPAFFALDSLRQLRSRTYVSAGHTSHASELVAPTSLLAVPNGQPSHSV